MDPIIPILRFTYLFFNIYGTYKVLKAPAISPYDNGGPPNYRVIVQRRRDMEGIMAIWIVWCYITICESIIDPLEIYFPTYDEIKSIFFLFLIFTRAYGAKLVYLCVVRPFIKSFTQILDTSLDSTSWFFGDVFAILIFRPAQVVYALFKWFTPTFPRNSSRTGDVDEPWVVGSDRFRSSSTLKRVGSQRRPRHSQPIRGENDRPRGSFLALLFTILEYPPFDEVIHWDGVNRVVLEQPRTLESYILMPVFGIPTLDVFKRKLYMLGFDCVPHRDPGQTAHLEASAWEHFKFTRLNPPMGFVRRNWSEEFKSDEPDEVDEPDGTMPKGDLRLRGPVPIPVSVDGGKTLDWSRHLESESSAKALTYMNPLVHHERKLAVIRLGVKPKARGAAAKVAEDLQRRYDLIFLRLETPKPVRLTAAVRWGISNSKIPAHAWKSPIPTQVIEGYLADDRPALSILGGWVQVVDKFISKCDHLDGEAESDSQVPSRTYSRTSSISEGHVSPEDDGPSKKVVHYQAPTPPLDGTAESLPDWNRVPDLLSQ